MKNNTTLIGILGGVAVGALLGILFAPDKGTSTRNKIAKKSSEATDDLKVKFENITNSLTEKYNSLVSKGEELVDNEMNKMNIENIKKMNKGLGN